MRGNPWGMLLPLTSTGDKFGTVRLAPPGHVIINLPPRDDDVTFMDLVIFWVQLLCPPSRHTSISLQNPETRSLIESIPSRRKLTISREMGCISCCSRGEQGGQVLFYSAYILDVRAPSLCTHPTCRLAHSNLAAWP